MIIDSSADSKTVLLEIKYDRKEGKRMKKAVHLDENGHRKFGIRDSVAYAAGDLGCNMSFALKGTMALFWTQVMGMGYQFYPLYVHK